MNIKQVPAHANNFSKGREGKTINMIVLHWIVGTLESADATFQNPTRKASAHYGVGDAEIHQYVAEDDTAWHAGNWNANLTSIGIETEGGWEEPKNSGKRVKPSEQTHKTTAELVASIAKRYNIPLDRTHIKKHSEVSDKATSCCGTLDVDLIVEMARELNNPPESEIIDPNIDIPGEYEEKWKLKSYKVYNNKWSISDMMKNHQDLADENAELTAEIVKNNKEIENLRSRNAEQSSVISERDKQITALTNDRNRFENLYQKSEALVAEVTATNKTLSEENTQYRHGVGVKLALELLVSALSGKPKPVI